jgi:hypothetical protein
MNIQKKARQVEKVLGDNSPLILTAFGVVGVATTAYLTGKATLKADKILAEDNENRPQGYIKGGIPRTKRETFELVWKVYIPPFLVGTLTCGSIIMANRIGTRRAAAMAGALAISERAYDEYREKVRETIGKNKEDKLRTEIQQKRVDENPPTAENVIITGNGEVLCKDAYSGRYFKSSMEEIKAAQNHVNHMRLNSDYASLTDFYNFLGLEPTKESDNVGWNTGEALEVMFTSAISDKQEPVLVMDFVVGPIRNFWKVH